VDYAVVALLGALVGGGELIARYRDAPARALHNLPAYCYVALNALASLAALKLTHIFGWTFGASASTGAAPWTQILVAGTGAMALFRSSLFTIHVGDKDVGVGPIAFLQIFRDATDRAVDRLRAKARSDQVAKIMEGLSYAKASAGLPPYCLALMQNVPSDEQVSLTKSLTLLDEAQIDEAVKVRILGLQLMNLVGPSVLTAAVASLRDEMKSV
jgi:hypothetical protein